MGLTFRNSHDLEEISLFLEILLVSIVLGGWGVVDHGARKREPKGFTTESRIKISYLIKGHQAILNILLLWLTLFIIDPHESSCNQWWQLERDFIWHLMLHDKQFLNPQLGPHQSMLHFLTLGFLHLTESHWRAFCLSRQKFFNGCAKHSFGGVFASINTRVGEMWNQNNLYAYFAKAP
jgi:hypothetical protein